MITLLLLLVALIFSISIAQSRNLAFSSLPVRTKASNADWTACLQLQECIPQTASRKFLKLRWSPNNKATDLRSDNSAAALRRTACILALLLAAWLQWQVLKCVVHLLSEGVPSWEDASTSWPSSSGLLRTLRTVLEVLLIYSAKACLRGKTRFCLGI
jgi:hypothetical protein